MQILWIALIVLILCDVAGAQAPLVVFEPAEGPGGPLPAGATPPGHTAVLQPSTASRSEPGGATGLATSRTASAFSCSFAPTAGSSGFHAPNAVDAPKLAGLDD